MKIRRRICSKVQLKRVGLATLSSAALLLTAACGAGSGSNASGPINVGSILDQTGPLNIYGTTMQDATKLAIKDINQHGGVLGRKLNLISYDAQSDNSKYSQYANQAAMKDHVAVLMGGITSASREAIRPIADRTDTLYFYNEQYEGGVCDRDTFNTGVVPSQQLRALIPYAIKHFGPKLYVVAADYNYGQISAKWVQKYAAQAGGTVVKTQFVPLESSDFGSIINGLQAAKPDVVVSLLVGGNHIAFYRQFASAGLSQQMKIVSPTFGLGNEQVILGSVAKGIVVAFPYFEELRTPANEAFLKEWHAAYGNKDPYVTDSAVAVWNGWHLWAKAANQAKSVDREKVISALQSGVSFDSPSGTVTMNGASHHVTQDVSIGVGDGNKGFRVLTTQKSVPPAYENQVCNLKKHPDTNKQFTP